MIRPQGRNIISNCSCNLNQLQLSVIPVAYLCHGTSDDQALREAVKSPTITKEGLKLKQITLTDFKVRIAIPLLARYFPFVVTIIIPFVLLPTAVFRHLLFTDSAWLCGLLQTLPRLGRLGFWD